MENAVLTPRERQVCMCLLRGLKYRQIGAELGLRRNSVALLAKRVYRQLGVTGQACLMRLAIMRGWIAGADRGLHWTRREEMVLNGALNGRSQRLIAEGFGVSLATVNLTLRTMEKGKVPGVFSNWPIPKASSCY